MHTNCESFMAVGPEIATEMGANPSNFCVLRSHIWLQSRRGVKQHVGSCHYFLTPLIVCCFPQLFLNGRSDEQGDKPLNICCWNCVKLSFLAKLELKFLGRVMRGCQLHKWEKWQINRRTVNFCQLLCPTVCKLSRTHTPNELI